MTILNRYIFKKLIWHYIITVLLLVVIAWISQSLKLFSKILTANVNFLDYLHISALLIPYILFNIMPIALAITLFSRINTLKADNELIAMKSSGVDDKQIYQIFSNFIFVIVVIHMLISMIILPLSHSEFEYKQKSIRENIGASLLQSGSFLDFNNVMIFIDDIGDNNEISGIMVFDNREDNEIMFIAQSGALEDGSHLRLQNGVRILKDDDAEQMISFGEYTTNLNNFIGSKNISNVDRNAQFIGELLLNSDNSPYHLKKISMVMHRILWPLLAGAVALLIVSQLGVFIVFTRGEYWKNNILTAAIVIAFFSAHMLTIKLGQHKIFALFLTVINFFFVILIPYSRYLLRQHHLKHKKHY